ncbi:MAG: TonB-dependent receptor [Bacteroidales bacterium]|nr:TonB-dependent receptor [Bacteroidales bacterium]
MNRGACIALILFSLSYYACAQSGLIITGKILDGDELHPVPGAEIILNEKSVGTLSDAYGNFRLDGLSSGTITLTVRHIGYKVLRKKVELADENIEYLTLLLTPDIKTLSEFVLTDKAPGRSRIPGKAIPVSRMSPLTDGTVQHDLGDYMRNAANISGIRKGAIGIDPVIRGFKYSQLNVQINGGHKIEGGCPNRMDPATSHVEMEDLESVSVIKGPYALRFGPSLGGVISLETHIPVTASDFYTSVHTLLGYESNWNGFREHLRVTAGGRGYFLSITGGRKEYDDYNAGTGDLIPSSFTRYNFKLQAGALLSDHQKLVLSAEEQNGYHVAFPALPMDERRDHTRLASMDYSYLPEEGRIRSIIAKAYYSVINHLMDNKERPSSDTVTAVSEIDAVNRGVRMEASLHAGQGNLTLGVDIENILKDGQRTKSMILQPALPVKRESLWNRGVIVNTGFFTDYSLMLGSYEVTLAARLDINHAESGALEVFGGNQQELYRFGKDSIRSDFLNFSVSAGVHRMLNEYVSFSLALGRGVRSPDMTERFIILLPIGYDPFDYLGNPALKPETNNQIDIGLKYQQPQWGEAGLTCFYSLVENFITGQIIPPSVQKPLSKDVVGVKKFHNGGLARLRGFEMEYTSPGSLLISGGIRASFTYGTIAEAVQYTTDGQGDPTGQEVIANDALSEIPPFEASGFIQGNIAGGKLKPKISCRLVAPQNHVSEVQYEKKTPGFIVANIAFIARLNGHIEINGGVNNLFDASYYEHLNRNIIGSELPLYEPGRVFYINLVFSL